MNKTDKKMLAIVAFGTGFEYYDFVIYALFINVISGQFFSLGDGKHALIWAVMVVATGYLARPLGGVVFGLCGDKYGRKPVFFASMLIMALATLIMGLAPGWQSAGIAGTVIFAGARFFQGLSYGAEMPGAMVYVAESSARDRRSSACALMLTGACLGASLATLVYWLSLTFFGTVALAAWGWRLPFLFGFVLALVALWFRKKMLETKEFKALASTRRPLAAVVGALEPKKILLAILLVLFPASYVLLNSLFLPMYVLQPGSPITANAVALAMFAGNLWCALLLPKAGMIIDRYDRLRFFKTLLLIVLAVNPLLFWLLHLQTLAGLYLFVIVNQTLLAFFAPTYMVFLPELFAVSGRFTAVSLVYNIAYSLAAFVPMVLLWLEQQHNLSFDGGMLFFELLALLTVVVCWLFPKKCFNNSATPGG